MADTPVVDDCAPACKAPRFRFVCPKNGEREWHAECEPPHFTAHRREELAPRNARLECARHGVPLTRAQG